MNRLKFITFFCCIAVIFIASSFSSSSETVQTTNSDEYVEWDANFRYTNVYAPGNPIQGEPLEAVADPLYDAQQYYWYIDNSLIAITSEPIYSTYSWLCGDHKMGVQAVTPYGVTEIKYMDYWGMCH